MRRPRGALGADPVLFRLGFVALALLFGKGVLLYLILLAVMPSSPRAAIA
ncbi:MAG: PspC domain-containing protein [Deltaproteobacteria bacterium]|nr:PspC domain-containing protein [Deltaproteobacteria bacterium]